MTSTTIRNPAQRKKVEGKDDRDSSNASADHEKQQPSKKPTIVTFPEQLTQVLSDPECRGSIAWSADGNSFAILRKQKFIDEVLPKYFRHCQMSSFQRKLNRWGFRVIHIVTDGRQDSAYFNKNFQRDNLSLLEQMSCKNKKSAVRSHVYQHSANCDSINMNLSSTLNVEDHLRRKRKADFTFSQQPTFRMPWSRQHQHFMEDGVSISSTRQLLLDSQRSTLPLRHHDVNSRASFPLSSDFLSDSLTNDTYQTHLSSFLSHSDRLQKLRDSVLSNNELHAARIRSLNHQDLLSNMRRNNLVHSEQLPLFDNAILQQQLINETNSLRLTGARQVLEELMLRNSAY